MAPKHVLPASPVTVSALVLALLLAGAAAAGCSTQATDEPASPAPSSTGGPTGSPAGSPSPTAPPTSTATPPAGPPVTTIRVHYAGKPGTLSLRGSTAPLSWEKGLAFTQKGAGLWEWSSTEVKVDTEYKPMLGDTWSRGPNYKVKPGATLDVYPRFFESHGSVEKKYPSFVSTKLPSTRGLWVYLPPTYIENTESRFPVLYMHDGQNLFTPGAAFGGNEWKVDETMDAAAEDGTIRETIVVGVENTANRIEELTPTVDPGRGEGGKADQYLSMLVTEIKPLIDKDLRTVPAREQTAIMGSSLGGLVSAYAGVKHADVFGLVGEMSPSTWWDGTMILGQVSTMASKPVRPLKVYVDSGDQGASQDDMANTKLLAARYRTVGYADGKDLLYVMQAGASHNEVWWADRLPAALRFLLGPR